MLGWTEDQMRRLRDVRFSQQAMVDPVSIIDEGPRAFDSHLVPILDLIRPRIRNDRTGQVLVVATEPPSSTTDSDPLTPLRRVAFMSSTVVNQCDHEA
jgi:hypothetical protein